MNLIEIVHSEGMGIAEPIMPGDSIAVEAGDTINYNVALGDVTGIARVGDDLYLTVQESAATRLEGYFFFDFSVKPLMLNFTDAQLSVSDVKEFFDLSLDKVDSEGQEQPISLRSGSIVPVGFNEIYYCDAEQYNLKNLQRRGDDLFLMSTEQPDQAKIILQGFFIPPELGQEPPQLQLTDPKSGTAKDVLIHPQSAVFGWQGEPLPRAVEGALYAYYFKLEGHDAETFNLTATSNGEELPRWLTFAYLGKGQYLLWGLPPHEAVGELNISIYAHSLNQKIGLHTQQAFPLAILSANDTTTRPGVDDVAAAEFRKLEGHLASENYAYLMMTEATLPYMSSAEIAAVSVLAAANFNVYGSLNSSGLIYADFRPDDETPISMQYLYKDSVLQTLLDPKNGSDLLPSTESNLMRSLFGDAVTEPIAPAEYNTEASLGLTQILATNSESVTTEETNPTTDTLDSILSGANSTDNFFLSLRIGAPPAALTPEPPTPPPPTPITIVYPSPGDGSGINTLWFQNGPGTVNFIGQNEYFNFANLLLEADGNVPVYLSIDGVGLTNLLNNTGQLFIDGVLIDSTRVFPGDIHLSPVQNTPGYTTYIANDGSILQISNDVVVTSYVDDAMDLNGDHGFVVTSLHPSGSFSYFSTITDLNGDGIGDLVIVDPFFYDEVTVIFGSSTPFAAQIDAASPGVQSVVFTGLSNPGAVSSAGDFNGDGFGDLLISSTFGNTAFIVFGQASFGSSADLPTLALSGGAMEITTFGSFTGGAGLGDINGDGLADIALNNNMNRNVYVVLGSNSPPTSIDVSTLDGTNGFTVVTPGGGTSIAGISFVDINADGYNDLIFKTYNPGGEKIWTIFGKASGFPAVIDTSTMTSGDGFAIIDSSIGAYRAFGRYISNIGDINNDGMDDFAIGQQFTGKVYVIFGSPAFSSGTTFDVATLDGTNGFTLTHSPYLFIQSIAFAGDVNGDGIADFVLGDYAANGFQGAAYVIFGSNDPFTAIVDMIQTDPTKGLTIQHYSQGNGLVSVGGGGDVNGDGLDDIILSNSGLNPPAANVVFGANFSNYITIFGNDSEIIINGTGDDVIFAGTADHIINLGPGNNYVNTGTGNAIVNGGSGNDTIVFSELLVSVSGGSGNDTLLFQQDGITKDFTATAIFSGIDNIDLKALLTKVGNKIELDAATISTMSDSNHITVNGGGMDVLTLSNNATDMWSSVVGPTYTTYTATAGLYVGTSVDVANMMQPVIIM